MKIVKLELIALLILFTAIGCKETKKENATTEKQVIEKEFSLIKDSTKVSFVGYKTTEKKPVGGQFTKITITESHSGATALEAMNGTKFNIPVSSLFTNDPSGTRDPKIIKFFFGAMENTSFISGIFKHDKTSTIDITLNGKTANIPLKVTKNSETSYTFNGVMDLANWDALGAVESINKACEILHTGNDGISLTWSEVAVQADVLLEKK